MKKIWNHRTYNNFLWEQKKRSVAYVYNFLGEYRNIELEIDTHKFKCWIENTSIFC